MNWKLQLNLSQQEVKEMKQSDFNLTAISPIDGRYSYQAGELSEYSSEYGLIKYRTFVEIQYLIALSKIGVTRKIDSEETKKLNEIINEFTIEDAQKIKKIEETTRHDVKAVEYFLKQALSKSSLEDILEFIHFGLTSEDINNLTIRLMLKDALNKVVLQDLRELDDEIYNQSRRYKKLPMLARTHGQAAIPTALGKEFLVFHERLQKEIKIIENSKYLGKLNGAIGNYNALNFTYPQINWPKFSRDFISSLGLTTNPITNQIAPFEDIIFIFQTVQRINGILLDFNQDMWRYISDHWFIQENKKGEVGSSTMPQKINPIMFENAEGNLIIANSLIEGFTSKLPISRLQRDLSNSTIARNFGLCLAYCSLAYKNSLSGLQRLKANEEKIKEDLNSDWSILSEAVQIYLKKHRIKNGYEILKEHTRGQKMTEEEFKMMIENLPLNTDQKTELKKLTPENYIGII
jgi:adenylosuccinate lyase